MDPYYAKRMESSLMGIYERLAVVHNRLMDEDCEFLWADVCSDIQAMKDMIVEALVDIDYAKAERSR